ncbi:MAG TPA: hypothetical protein VM715_11775, partial [Candidatus Acidoferrum sp.]|nr:hypothetical protein [Candidatus Acidoferrum sp.]
MCPECRLKPSGLPSKAYTREKRSPDPPPPSENQPGENVTPNSYFFRTLLEDKAQPGNKPENPKRGKRA